MTLEEAIQVFDYVLPLDSAIGVPYCCGIPVTQNSQNGNQQIYCGACGRAIEPVARQWVVAAWGSKGIKLPMPERAAHTAS